MYLDQGEEMNLTRSLNNYITMASQVVRQVWATLTVLQVLPLQGYHHCVYAPCTGTGTAGSAQLMKGVS